MKLTKSVTGDLSVSRNIINGGDLDVKGNARIGHNLKVDGCIEAKKIKSADKGLFATTAQLRETYPTPQDGWYAAVPATEAEIEALGATIETGKTALRMYHGEAGLWVAVGGIYEVTIDNNALSALTDDVSQLELEVDSRLKSLEKHPPVIAIQGIYADMATASLAKTPMSTSYSGQPMQDGSQVWFVRDTNCFILISGLYLYRTWESAGQWFDTEDDLAYDDALYICTGDLSMWKWDGYELRRLGVALQAVTSEEMAALAASGEADPNTVYYTPEES